MNESQKKFVLGLLSVSPFLILIGLNTLEVPSGTSRTVVTFLLCPALILAAKFLSLGWRNASLKILEDPYVGILLAVFLHLAFTDYTGDKEKAFSLGNFLGPEPGIDSSWSLILGVVLPIGVVWLVAEREKHLNH